MRRLTSLLVDTLGGSISSQPFHPALTKSGIQRNLTALHESNSASPSVVHPGEGTVITKKKKKAKLELASLVAKDLEELSRKRAVKQEPADEMNNLLEMSCSNGLSAFTTSFHGEGSIMEIETEDLNSSPLKVDRPSIIHVCLYISSSTIFSTFFQDQSQHCIRGSIQMTGLIVRFFC
jgi:hypothetical protein